ncbi:MarR family transcriptional regulator [uncultured Clostridium sp.]|jgi:DNA-binding MarR family transcriptional regulator|uniref:MarR family winged helix-turn-helix transcriptional regulator n=1 Tax=uncultured Clostridium sp. TaxID=59620 RepID=UPI002610FA45|nr:MarR family transcriptional regulator [uncultured Clostridium sp.]
MDKNKLDIKKDIISLGALVALKRANNLLEKNEIPIKKETGLTMGQFAVLEILYSKGDLVIAEIIEGVLSTSGNITVVIKNLKRDGYIIQIANPNDKRSSLISLTNKGIEIIERILPKHFENITNSFSELTRDEKNFLIKLLRKIK